MDISRPQSLFGGQDGQILAVSFSQGLADVEAMSLFLQAWSRCHGGEERLERSDDARSVLEGAVNNAPGPFS